MTPKRFTSSDAIFCRRLDAGFPVIGNALLPKKGNAILPKFLIPFSPYKRYAFSANVGAQVVACACNLFAAMFF